MSANNFGRHADGIARAHVTGSMATAVFRCSLVALPASPYERPRHHSKAVALLAVRNFPPPQPSDTLPKLIGGLRRVQKSHIINITITEVALECRSSDHRHSLAPSGAIRA